MEKDFATKVETLFEHAFTYAEQRKDLFLLDVTEKASRAISETISGILIAVFGVLILLFASISAGLAIGLAMENIPMGFLFVALFYLIVLIIALTVNKSFMQPWLINYFIKKFHKQTNL